MESLSDFLLASDVPDELLCPSCRNVASEPYQVLCCGQVFCRRCLEKDRAGDDNTCVKCRRKRGKSVPDTKREKEIENIMVRCYISSERGGGCSWEGQLKRLRAHKDECAWRAVTCRSCQESVYFKDLRSHESDSCPGRPYSCPHCPFGGTYEQVTIVHFREGRCPDQRSTCPNGCSVRSSELESHVTRCPSVPCPYLSIGCNAVMTKAEMASHERDSQSVHLRLAMEKMVYLNGAVDKLKSELHVMAQKPIAVFRMKKEDFELLRSSYQPWTSPSVYTYDRGYNLHLRVSTCNGKALSLTVHLLPGRYDNDLPWPCQAQVAVELLNQACDGGHHLCSIDLEACEARRTYEPGGAGFGTEDFISFDQLKYSPLSNAQYLGKDGLYFRVRAACDSTYKPWLSEFVWHRDKGTV